MISKAQKVRLGIFLMTGLAFLVILLILIAGSKMMEKRDRYYIIYDDVSVNGLQIGGQVMYHGIRIGRVDDIRIQKNDVTKVVVEISVRQETPIKTDVEATLVPVGITGLKQIELTGGSNHSKTLEPDSFIKPGKSLLDNITDRAESIAAKIDAILSNIIVLTNKDNQDRINNILMNLDEMVIESRGPMKATLNNVDSLTYELAKTTASANKMVAHINDIVQSGKIDRIVNNTETFTRKMSELDTKKMEKDLTDTAANLNETVAKANVLLNRIDALVQKSSPEITATVESLRETIDNLNEFSRLVSEDPSILIKSRKQNTNP